MGYHDFVFSVGYQKAIVAVHTEYASLSLLAEQVHGSLINFGCSGCVIGLVWWSGF